jgi:hypothetical protein
MHHARRTLQLAATPAFLALAIVSLVLPSPICTIPGPYGYLTSMWFMYLVMGAVHAPAWFPLAVRLLPGVRASALPALDCCAPSVQEMPKRQEPRTQSPRLA